MESQILLLEPLGENQKVTQARKNQALLALADKCDIMTYRPAPEHDDWAYMTDEAWWLAEFRKYGRVRITKEKRSGHWIATTYGSIHNEKAAYYGLDANTGEMIDGDRAKYLFHTSKI